VGYFFEVAAAAMTTAGSEGVGDVDKWGIFFEVAAAAMTTGGGEGLGDVDKWGILFEVAAVDKWGILFEVAVACDDDRVSVGNELTCLLKILDSQRNRSNHGE